MYDVGAAPTITVHILSVNGSCNTLAFPDSGADISATGPQLLRSLGKHTLLPSEFTLKTGQSHSPIGTN